MEWLGWLLFGLFYVGPYIVGALLVMAAAVVAPWIAFTINRQLGFATVAVVIASAGTAGYVYLVQGPSAFNAACNSGTGIHVFKDVQPEPYVLTHARNMDAGLAKVSDATVEDAIVNVANGSIEYTEVQDWNDASHRYGIRGYLVKFRDPAVGHGYFKIHVDSLGSRRCRWLMPEDVGGMSYSSYLSQKLEHPLNAKLAVPDNSKRCVAVDYVTSPSARYAIEFLLDQPITKNLLKHEIRIVDVRDDKALIGNSVAYQHKADGVYASAAFWVGNGKRHPTCPINLLEGKPVRKILKVGTPRRDLVKPSTQSGTR